MKPFPPLPRKQNVKCRRHFANAWQKRAKFAKHWQNPKRARPMDLPIFGKNAWNLPNIGKTC
jgi:hypothetical protein